MTAGEFRDHFKKVCPTAKPEKWSALCPAHDDHVPSLEISHGEKRSFVKCFVGCDEAAILAAAGLTTEDVWYAPKSNTPKLSPTPKEVASYSYVNEQGEPRYRVVRYAPKMFKQCRPDPARPGKVIWNLGTERRLLYHLDKIQAEKAVALAEGEKDTDRLIAEGILATTNSGGSGQWSSDHVAQLKAAGITCAYVLPDADSPGAKWAARVRETCAAAGIVAVVCHLDARPGLEPGWDVSDWLDAGGTAVELRVLLVAAAAAAAAPRVQPPDPEPDFDADVPAPLVKPRIVIDGTQSLDVLADAVWNVLLNANEPPVILRRGGELVRLVREKSGRASLRELTKARLKARLVRVADFRKSDAENAKVARVPDDLVEDMMVDDDRDVPPITRIVEAPVFLPDGRLLAERGYDAASGVLYAPPPCPPRS